jgi:hypothetical protein
MGHSEMGLAVAGLKEDEITRRVRRLADGDWSEFHQVERLAFQFAHKLSREPSAISDKEVQGLVEAFGRHRAVDVIWRSSWYNYMTRVADAFQLPLERENVFAILKKEKEKEAASK